MPDYIQEINKEINNENSQSGFGKVLDKCVRTFFSRYKWVIFGVVLILILILIVLNRTKPTSTNNLPKINNSLTSVDLCAKFPKVQGEITCEEAVTNPLKAFPGEIISVDIINKNINGLTKEAWLLTIKLNKPISLGENIISVMEMKVDKQL